MKNNTKIFEKSLHDENDIPAREIVKQVYGFIGIDLYDNPDRYGVDLLCDKPRMSVEVERRLVWEGGAFPYDTVNFLLRKVKFMLHCPSACDYAIVSKDFKHIGIINGVQIMDIVFETEPQASANKYVQVGEQFYKIPRDKFRWHKI